jgi:catechol 2,3-dioxygenase-like lactoylglutathione lyase family enzyme
VLRFVCPLIVVDEIARSRHFYEQLLGQKARNDFGANVEFDGNFSIHLAPRFQAVLGDAAQYPVTNKAHDGELYFETDQLEPICQRLHEAGVEFIHAIREQPWAQRATRLYDPDGHIVEIGEPMETVVWRLHGQGLSVDQISAKTSMPRKYVERVTRERPAPGQVGG